MPAKPKRGRPKSRPPGAFARLYWLTQQEHAAVKALVAKMRSGKAKAG